MKLLLTLSLVLMINVTGHASSHAEPASFRFGEIDYFHRWAKDDQHEYTPEGQEDLAKWSDMLTVNRYQTALSGEALASVANAVLENYKANHASLLKTDSVPRTVDRPAEYLIVVLFPRPLFIEAVFARFRMTNGVGSSFIYSHREYGKKIGDEISAWLQKNGPSIEKNLMTWAPSAPVGSP